MSTRITLITELIAPYRIPVFNALARHPGVDLQVIFLSETDAKLREWSIYRQEIHFSYAILPSWRMRMARHSLLLNRGLSRALRLASPDTIICGGYNYPSSWRALRWARKRNIPFVLWSESNQQDTRIGNGGTEFLKRYFARSCQAFAVPGKCSFAYLRSLGVGEKHILTAPNAVDNSYFAFHAERARTHEPTKEGLPKRFILCVARLVREKGIFDLLEAYGKLESSIRNEVGLVFAGNGPAKIDLMLKAQNVRPGHIVFPGFVQRKDLAVLYALAEALVLPTHSDPWGLVVNEGMACGLPVVVTNVAGCSADLVADGWNGFLVPPQNVNQLKDAIERLLLNRELGQQMGMRSAQRIQEYSPEACATGLAAAAFAAVGQAQ